MNRKALAESISEDLNLPKKTVLDVLEKMEKNITTTLAQGGRVTLAGFGMFFAAMRKGRRGVNPQNPKEEMQIPEVRVPKFRAGKNLKEAIKQ
ncbi:HU family DNA-binding protein [Patescibacteria group bacterium]